MATITSTGSGNFGSTSTWVGGVVPVDGDGFIVNYGHLVTIDDDQRVTNGYDDSYVRGKLQITGTGKLRMNGILYVDNTSNYTAYFSEGNSSTAGFFRMDAGALLEIRGTNSDQHRLHVQAQQYVTCEIYGTNPNPSTTLNGAVDTNVTSLTFTNASNFRIGDWISVYYEDYGSTYAYNKSDEGFWIHDIDGNTVYFRHYVSPTCTIQMSSGNVLKVDDAAVFRNGTKIIFGTGSNRNVGTISSIDYVNNKITFSDSIAGSVVGEKIYQTGTEKCHYDGSTILRIAATLTANQASGQNTIVVNNVNGFSVGDLILIPNNDLDNYYNVWDYVQDFYITDINAETNTITFSNGLTDNTVSSLPYSVQSGGIVVNMSRDTKITAPTYSTSEQSFITVYPYSNYTRRFKIYNTFINLGANTANSYYGSAAFTGSFSFDSVSYGQYVSVIDGVVIIPTNRTSYAGGGGWGLYAHYINRRNTIVYNGTYGLQSGAVDLGYFNNIICRNSSWAMYLTHNSFVGLAGEYCYNYCIRSAYGHYLENVYFATNSFRHNYILAIPTRPIQVAYSVNGYCLDRLYIDGFITWPFISSRASKVKFLNSYLGNKWDGTGESKVYNGEVDIAAESSSEFGRGTAYSGIFESIKHNFRYDESLIWGSSNAMRSYNKAENAWYTIPDRYYGGYCGFYNTLFIPANSKVYITAQVKTISPNTNYPYLIAKELFDYYDGKYKTLGDAALAPDSQYSTEIAGFTTQQRFTSSSSNDYESINMVLPAQSYDYMINIGVMLINSGIANSKYGWYEKDLIISIEKPYDLNDQSIFNQRTTQVPVRVKHTTDKLKIRLGG